MKLLASTILASLLTACGGGSGSADKSSSPSPSPTTKSASATPTPSPTVWTLAQACTYFTRADASDDAETKHYNRLVGSSSATWRTIVGYAPTAVKAKRHTADLLASPPFPWPTVLAEDVKVRRVTYQLTAAWIDRVAGAKNAATFEQVAYEPFMSQDRIDANALATENIKATCA